MGISINDLPPKAREQAMIKVAIEEARRRNKTTAIPGATPKEKKEPKQNKYRAQKVEGCLNDGTPHTFDSVKEFDRYQQLALMERAGEISDLQVQKKFPLVPPQKLSDGSILRGMDYICDFAYMQGGEQRIEDVKGYKNPASAAYRVFQIKKKLMKWIHNVEVYEI